MANKLFASGFELNTALAAKSGQWQDVIGTDNSTGYNWGTALWGGKGSIQILTTAWQNELQTVTGYNGTPTTALFQSMNHVDPNASGNAQIPLIFLPTTSSQTDLYSSQRFKLQPNLTSQIYATGAPDANGLWPNWRTLWEFKTGSIGGADNGDLRIIINLSYNGGTLHWSTSCDNIASNTYPNGMINYWSVNNFTVPIPIGVWFKFETFVHRHLTAGTFWAKVNGQYICNQTNVKTMGDSSLPINRYFASTVYTNGNTPAYQWVDDIEFWDGVPSGNNPPTANAGADQTITLPTNFVTLNGSGIDTDGTITTYHWLQTSGTAATITSPNSASTTITGLTNTSVFQLTVTDNFGSTATDTVTITVNPVPLAATQYIVSVNSATVAASSPITITAQLADINGMPVKTSGKIVNWSHTGSGGIFQNTSTNTDANGIASVIFTTGTVIGTSYSFTASSDNNTLTGTSGTVQIIAQGLLSRWIMNEASGIIAADSISGRDLILSTTGATWTSDSVVLNSGYLSGSGLDFGFNNTAEISVAIKLKTSQLFTDGLQHKVFNKEITTGWYTWEVNFMPGGALRFDLNNHATGVILIWTTTAANFNTGVWHTIVFTYKKNAINATDATVYIDGVVVATNFSTIGTYSSGFVLEENSNYLLAGARPESYDGFFNGEIKEFRVYNKKLTSTEVAALSTDTTTTTTTGAPPSTTTTTTTMSPTTTTTTHIVTTSTTAALITTTTTHAAITTTTTKKPKRVVTHGGHIITFNGSLVTA